MAYIARLMVIFAVAFSLASLAGPMSSHFQLPRLRLAHAVAQTCNVTIGSTCSEYWVPAGPAMDTYQGSIFANAQAEFTNIQSASPSIELTDFALTPDLTGPFTTSSNFRITSQSSGGFAEVEFMLANNFWGVNFNFGNDPNGVEIRQGIAHMVDKAKFVASEPLLAGQATATDTPEPQNSDNLYSANPCAWDAQFSESGSNCKVGAPGATAYRQNSAGGANGIPYLQAPGSPDLNEAAVHFVRALLAGGCDGLVGANSCEISSDSKLSGISIQATNNPVVFYIRNDNQVLLHLGDAYAEQICYIFTGSYTIPCPELSVIHGPIPSFPGLTTSTNSVNLSWGMYTAGIATSGAIGDASFGGCDFNLPRPCGDPFDNTLYFKFNSQFASDISSIQPPNRACSSAGVPTVSASNYMYLCDPTYDSLTSQMEFAPCLSVTGDPTLGSTSNTSTGHCPGTTSTLSAIGAAIEAEDQFGKNAYTIPVYTMTNQFGYLNDGFTRVINGPDGGLSNFFTYLDTYNPGAPLSGTVRQGLWQTTLSVNPYVASTASDSIIIGNIYDTLAKSNPLSTANLVDWMALSVQQLSNPSLTYTPPGGACTSPNVPVGCTSQTFRFTLRSDMFWQDERKVTSFDVAFSYLSLRATGAFQGGALEPMTGVTILGPSQIDINLNAVGLFTLPSISQISILPGAYWTASGSSSWATGITKCTALGNTCYPAQYILTGSGTPVAACALSCASFPDTLMNVNLPQTVAGYDPIVNHNLVGSGPWTCGVVTNAGSSTSCSSTGAMNPPTGGSYVLSRFGKGLAPASSVNGDYFRSNGNLAAYLWSQDTGDITHDFLNFSVVSSCFGTPVTSTGPCAHFQQGIGANGGPIPVGLSQVAIVNRFVGLNWTAPLNWASSPPVGIIPLSPVLYENTITLNPASVAGCTTPYPTGGYDC